LECDSSNAAHVALSNLVESAHIEHDGVLRMKPVVQVEASSETILVTWMGTAGTGKAKKVA
jgi:calcineurin-like phosphoesterase family protein